MNNWLVDVDNEGFICMTNKHNQGEELEVYYKENQVYDYSKQSFIPLEVALLLQERKLKVPSNFIYATN